MSPPSTHTFDYEHLRIVLDGPVARATLNRPEVSNALNSKLVEELRDFFVRLFWLPDIRIVVLDGHGRNFCAGFDLKERAVPVDPATSGALRQQRAISEIVVAMRRCPQPIVTLINGAASGGGFALALASDVRVAATDARMNAAFIRIGLSACDIGVSYFLPRMVGASVASEYMLTGRFLDAVRAQALGLVAAVAPPGELASIGEALVDDMLHATPLGLRLTKEALNHAIDASGLEAVIAMEDRNQILCAQSEDFAEGVAAFREKRLPNYAQSLSTQTQD
jgi:enoyl-CoA hydratase/carnithine racemase